MGFTTGVDDNAGALKQLDGLAVAGSWRVVLRLDVDVERSHSGCATAVRYVEREAGDEVFAAVVLEADVAVIDVFLGERTQQAQGGAVE